MTNNKNPNEKKPGEKEPGKFHYNPGNMSGKTIGTNQNQSAQTDAVRPDEEDKSKIVDR